jgi:ABC-type multidrug transport system ATPase subunit
MLTISGLRKSFGGRPVLDGLDLDIRPGESVALLGANGSGKTTMLRCVIGLARPDAGTIAIGGADLATDAIDARRRISYLPQRSTFPPTLTVRETLEAVARLRRLDRTAVNRELAACGLAALAGESVGHLSGGERQRVAMAVAFLPTVDLYLFDEPSANLDSVASRMLVERAAALSEAGRTLLFTTHVPADVRRLAKRIVLLRNGRVEADTSGEFEVRRYERMLEREAWGDGHEDQARVRAADDRDGDSGLRGADTAAGAGAARSR